MPGPLRYGPIMGLAVTMWIASMERVSRISSRWPLELSMAVTSLQMLPGAADPDHNCCVPCRCPGFVLARL